MPETNGYYCQCIHLTTRTKHTPPDKRGICRKDARHSTVHATKVLTYFTRPDTASLSSSIVVHSKVSPSAPHDSRIVLASTWVPVWVCCSSTVCSGFTKSKTNHAPRERLEVRLQRPGSCTDLIGDMEAETPRDRGD